MFKCKTCSQKFAVFHGKNYFSAAVLSVSLWLGHSGASTHSKTKPVYRRPTPGVDIPCRRYTGFRRHREVSAKPVYGHPTPQGNLRKAGIPASDVLRVKTIRCSLPTQTAIQLVNSFIVSCMGKCNSILSVVSRYQLDRIQSLLVSQ